MKRRKIVYNENEKNKNNFNKNLMIEVLLKGIEWVSLNMTWIEWKMSKPRHENSFMFSFQKEK